MTTKFITLVQYKCEGVSPDEEENPHGITISYRGSVGREGVVVICEEHERYCEPTGKVAHVPAEEVSKVRSSWGTN
jgi:hypothetical protein